jgi:pantoate kinase
MVDPALAWSPGHVSGYFRRCADPDGAVTGSVGGGIVIAEGVTVEAAESDAPSVRVLICSGGTLASVTRTSPPLEYLMDRLDAPAALTTRCTLPIGAGFGLSAAALLASGTALSALHGLELTRREIAAAAHEAEVGFRTGLGDVAAAQGGGVVVRRGPGIEAEILRFPSDEPVATVSFGPIPTPAVLDSADAMAQVRAAFPTAEPHGFEELVRVSRTFAERSGLVTSRVRTVLAACDGAGVPASMTMLGDGVFAAGPGADRVLARFGRVYRLHVATEGFHLLEAQS